MMFFIYANGEENANGGRRKNPCTENHETGNAMKNRKRGKCFVVSTLRHK
ncbi:hypothetical protein [uncultured Dialister sp.]|jgi:hypothetical protein|nr:hypothetical protein [uncultured Dialister sp.]